MAEKLLNVMTEFDSNAAAMPAGGFPYFTNADPALSRSSGGRDPLGLLPVWSAFGRRLVPNLASPVGQVNGIKAVVLIQWLINLDEFQSLLERNGARRRFFRLMEGLVEYWLYHNGQPACFGHNALAAGGERFSVSTGMGKTVANGLYQYYRGTCRRAGLVDDKWMVPLGVARQIAGHWTAGATRELKAALAVPLEPGGKSLFPGQHLGGALAKALSGVFNRDTLHQTLQQCLFGDTDQQTLAREFLALRTHAATKDLEFKDRVDRLALPQLADAIDCVQRCEPFLLVMQDAFDYLRGSPGKRLDLVARDLAAMLPAIGNRAARFVTLASEQDSARMKQMQLLAENLASATKAAPASSEAVLTAFLRELIAYHTRCMKERGRDPMVVIEGDTVLLPVPGDRAPKDASERLASGRPWMNDYYLNTASNLFGQLF
ncbi:hypothetical protein [Paraburkholderia dilworthii]|uniref:Uncharacterized protein n=1 Tax=Paraburkholderia dilworthii TaxID=948106 RepID=A0ABW9D231_9BURK